MKASPSNITSLEPNQIFVFGSNQSGRHGKGAAKTALGFGAKWGQAKGLQGSTYGIPTKNHTITRVLSIQEIKPYVDEFLKFSQDNPHLTFLVTEVGCGLAGYKPKDIAPLFSNPPSNVHLPERFIRVLKNGNTSLP